MSVHTAPVLEEALEWTAAGHYVVPIPRGRKDPGIRGWESLRLGADALPGRITAGSGLGLLLGITGLVDVDLDCPEARALARAVLPGTDRRHGRPGAPDSHWWYQAEGLRTAAWNDPSMEGDRARILEVRGLSRKGTPQQTNIPPTVHLSGEPMAWSARGAPASIPSDVLLERARLLAACVLVARCWPQEGRRHEAALHLAGALVRRRLDPDAVADIVETVARIAGDDEAGRRRLDAEDTCRAYAGGGSVSGLPQLTAVLRLDEQRAALLGTLLGQRDAFPIIPGQGKLAGFAVAGREAPHVNGERPLLDVSEMDLARITPVAWEAIGLSNDPPRLFRYGGALVRLQRNDIGAPVLVELDDDRLRYELAQSAHCFKLSQQGARISARPPKEVVANMLAQPDPPLPVLNRVVEAPVFAEDGELQTEPGYHEASQTYYAAPAGLRIPAVHRTPGDYEIEAARRLILDELFADFPFVGEADRAGAVALFLLAYCRDFIAGPTPNHLIEAPEPGSGKGLLAEAAVSPAIGHNVGGITEARDDDEWRKRITAVLREGTPVVLIDNVRRSLDSSSLASALTQLEWRDRLLGRSETVRFPIRCIWVTTANNPSMTTEMARRCIRIRLDAKRDQPWRRPLEQFRHPDLRSWCAAHRGRLVWAALTLIRHWVAQGRPHAAVKPLGSYEKWTHVMGGILASAGVPGFLENLDDLYADVDAQGQAWRSFVAVWWEKHRDQAVSAADLFPLAEQVEGLAISGSTERGMRTSFGQRLAAQRDRILGGFRVTRVGTSKRLAQWQLVETPDEVHP